AVDATRMNASPYHFAADGADARALAASACRGVGAGAARCSAVSVPVELLSTVISAMGRYNELQPVSVANLPQPDLQNQINSTLSELEREVSRRRTFAIISHPDAGKTTLTEKLLLYAGAIELAGAVRGRRDRRHATSDWMALEQERGISITAAALEFELEGRRMSLLDTPGHQDFSEDTYRALIAADSVVMVIDAAHGVEDQTRKLFEV